MLKAYGFCLSVLIVVAGACTRGKDLKPLEDRVDAFLQVDGTLSRGTEPVPRLPQQAYAAAHKRIEDMATAKLREFVSAPDNRNVVEFLDFTFRRYLNTDGTTMVRGQQPAPGRITLEQYMEATARFAEAATPATIELLRDPVKAVQFDAMIRGQ